jgi:hypothetical protein
MKGGREREKRENQRERFGKEGGREKPEVQILLINVYVSGVSS